MPSTLDVTQQGYATLFKSLTGLEHAVMDCLEMFRNTEQMPVTKEQAADIAVAVRVRRHIDMAHYYPNHVPRLPSPARPEAL